jgi:hypothetical protein
MTRLVLAVLIAAIAMSVVGCGDEGKTVPPPPTSADAASKMFDKKGRPGKGAAQE